MYENPSAGKFDAPPPPAESQAEHWNGSRIIAAVSMAFIGGAVHWLTASNRRGWPAVFGVLGAFGLGVAEFFRQRKRADERDEDNPYTPPTNLTR